VVRSSLANLVDEDSGSVRRGEHHIRNAGCLICPSGSELARRGLTCQADVGRASAIVTMLAGGREGQGCR
jgi:hypothetical protein